MRPEDRRVVTLLGFLHGMVHANVLSIPVFLIAWRSDFRADDVTLGLLAATVYAFYGLAAVPFGFLADVRPPGGLLGLCVGGIATALAVLASSPSITVLAVALGALGLFSGVYHPTGLSVISRSVTEPGRGMGWHGMGGSLGIAAGPAFVAGAITLGLSWRLVAGLLILPPVIGALLLLRQGLPGPGAARTSDPSAPRKTLLTLSFASILLVYMFAGFAYQGSLTFLPRFVDPGFYALALGLGAGGQVVSGFLADRRHPDRVLFALSLAAAALLVLLSWLRPSAAFTAAALAFGFLLFSLEPLQNTLVTGEVPPSFRGSAFGFTFLSVFGIGSLGAALAGWLLSQNESATLFLALGACLAAAGTFALGSRWKWRGP